ncbi:hypothetical protein HK101_007970, partial [Irineochytrium annulatum]
MSSVFEVRVKKSRLGIIMSMGGIKEKYRSLGEQMIDILTPNEISVMSSLQARQMQDELDEIRHTQALAEEKVGGFVTEWISYYKGFRSFTKFSEARMLGWVKGFFPQELDKNSANTFRIANGRDGCVAGVMASIEDAVGPVYNPKSLVSNIKKNYSDIKSILKGK